MVGRTLGHYEVLAKLGEGGMGVVYKARDTHLDRFVAVKVLPAREGRRPRSRSAVSCQEAKAASPSTTPTSSPSTTSPRTAGTDFIVMEYVTGQTLDTRIGHHGMRLDEALEVRGADRGCADQGARGGHRPPGPQADEHHGERGRRGEGPRLRPGEAHRARSWVMRRSPPRSTRRESLSRNRAYCRHGAPTCRRNRRGEAGGCPVGHLFARLGALRARNGAAAVSGAEQAVHAVGDSAAGAEAAQLHHASDSGELERLISRCLRKDPASASSTWTM